MAIERRLIAPGLTMVAVPRAAGGRGALATLAALTMLAAAPAAAQLSQGSGDPPGGAAATALPHSLIAMGGPAAEAQGTLLVPAAALAGVPRPSPLSPFTRAAAVAPLPVPPTGTPMQRAIAAEVAALSVDVSASVAAFYERRAYEPAWTPARAATLRARLADAASDGLDPAEYAVPVGLPPAGEDIARTEAALLYARHSHAGRVAPRTVSTLMAEPPPVLDEAVFLDRLARDPVVATLEAAHPQGEAYQALRRLLRETLARRVVAPAPIGPGPMLRIGDGGHRVEALRTRLGLPEGDRFDSALAAAVEAYQAAEGLTADGLVGVRTVQRLDAAAGAASVDVLIANLERWRFMPSGLGRHHVFVDIPAYEVRVVTDGRVIWRGRVIVGSPNNATPIFSDAIEHVVVNPYWNVPTSIASKEMLAEIKAGPSGWFARNGYEAVQRGKVVRPGSINWSDAILKTVAIRQRPGRGNALGDVKFLFPNAHDVYLHDTPSRGLFARDARALSHGCIRVDRPFEFAHALLETEEGLTAARLKTMVGGQQRWLNLATQVPVHLAYFTVKVGADGRPVRHGDIYGLDAKTTAALLARRSPAVAAR